MTEIVALPTEENKGMLTALGRVSGRADTTEVLRDSGCSTMVIREDLCDTRDFRGETRGCVMMYGRVIEVPVVKNRVDTPYYIGEVEGVAMKAPIYDLVIGNVHGASGQEDPDTSWEVPTGEEITEHDMSVESQDVRPVITSHEKTGGIASHEKTGGVASHEKTGGVASHEKTGGIASHEKTGGVASHEKTGGVASHEKTGGIASHEKTGGVVTILQSKNKTLRPMKAETSPPEKESVVHKQLVLPRSSSWFDTWRAPGDQQDI